MKRILGLFIATLSLLLSCTKIENNVTNVGENLKMYVEVAGTRLEVQLVDNVATRALVKKLEENKLVLELTEYGGFEITGPLGFTLPSEDKQISVEAGDIVLYNSNQISVFYDSNSWSYTYLGKIIGKNPTELKSLLAKPQVSLTFSLN